MDVNTIIKASVVGLLVLEEYPTMLLIMGVSIGRLLTMRSKQLK